MTNIEKALEAYPRPWIRTIGEETGWNYIFAGNGETFLIDDVGDEEIDLIIAAVNAYKLEKPCEACGGAGGYSGDTLIGYKYPPLPEALLPKGARPAMVKCSICNGTGKQPDAHTIDEYGNDVVAQLRKLEQQHEALKRDYDDLKFEFDKRDKAIRELMGVLEIFIACNEGEEVQDEFWDRADAALAEAKEVVG